MSAQPTAPQTDCAAMEPRVSTLDRESLARRWLGLLVERSSLEELAVRPLGRRLEDFDLMLEALALADDSSPVTASTSPAPPTSGAQPPLSLREQLDRVLAESAPPVALALLGLRPPARGAPRPVASPVTRAWRMALAGLAAEGQILLDAGDGASALLLPGMSAREGAEAAERITAAAWEVLGRPAGRLSAGVVAYPEDGAGAADLLATAHVRLAVDDLPDPVGVPPADGVAPRVGRRQKIRVAAYTGPAGGEPQSDSSLAGGRSRPPASLTPLRRR